MEPTTRRRTYGTRAFALLAVPIMLLTSCKISDVTDPIVKPIEDLFGLGSNEISTPKFEIVNGITIQVVIRIDDLKHGVPVTVRVRCQGGTEASQTVTVTPRGSVGIGETTFDEGWPAGIDCLVSQELVQGVETVESTLVWLDGNSVEAEFVNS